MTYNWVLSLQEEYTDPLCHCVFCLLVSNLHSSLSLNHNLALFLLSIHTYALLIWERLEQVLGWDEGGEKSPFLFFLQISCCIFVWLAFWCSSLLLSFVLLPNGKILCSFKSSSDNAIDFHWLDHSFPWKIARKKELKAWISNVTLALEFWDFVHQTLCFFVKCFVVSLELKSPKLAFKLNSGLVINYTKII